MSDVQAHSGDVWIEEVEVVVITEPYEGLGLKGVVLVVPGRKACTARR